MDHKSRGPGRPRRAWPPVAIGVCILALECSQILYNAVTRPDLAGDVARVLIAHVDAARLLTAGAPTTLG